MRSIVTRKQEKYNNGAALMEAGIPMPVEIGRIQGIPDASDSRRVEV